MPHPLSDPLDSLTPQALKDLIAIQLDVIQKLREALRREELHSLRLALHIKGLQSRKIPTLTPTPN